MTIHSNTLFIWYCLLYLPGERKRPKIEIGGQTEAGYPNDDIQEINLTGHSDIRKPRWSFSFFGPDKLLNQMKL